MHKSLSRFFVLALVVMALFALMASEVVASTTASPVTVSGTSGDTSTDPTANNAAYYLRYVGNPAPGGYDPSHNYQWATPALFLPSPEDGPVVLEGNIDVDDQVVGQVAMIGLLDRADLAAGNSSFQRGAYIYVYRKTATEWRIGVSDGNAGGGELVQSFAIIPGTDLPGDGVLDVTFTVDGTADGSTCDNPNNPPAPAPAGCMTLEVTGGLVNATLTDSYGDIRGANSATPEFSNGAVFGWDDYLGSNVAYELTMTPVDPPAVTPTTIDSQVCNSTTVDIEIDDVFNLYGYEFIVEYDQTLVSASGSFDQTWFGGLPSGAAEWDADCTSNPGECRFASTRVNPQAPINTVTPETVASITFTTLPSVTTPNSFVVDVTAFKLTNKESFTIPGATGGSLPLTTCGSVTVSGKINLQGRPQPGSAFSGVPSVFTVELEGPFGTYNATPLSADGTYSISGVLVSSTTDDFTITADHSVYLAAQDTFNMTNNMLAAGTVTKSTRLLGGDADDSGTVDISDLSCIGTQFGTAAPFVCLAAPDTADVNNDLTVNIQDLSLAAGNLDETEFQGW